MKSKGIEILSGLALNMKYAKWLSKENRRETWEELCSRNMDMHIKKYPELKEEIKKVYTNFVTTKKVLPSMRSMQFAGKPIELSPSRLYNCAYCPMDNLRSISELMFLLLGGSGVGYSVQNKHIEKLPEIKKPVKNRRYVISDSIEGWADAVKMLLKAYLEGKSNPTFDFSDIRDKGDPLITSGGKAPGAEPLKECLFNLKKVLDRKKDGEKLSSLEVHDMCCYIADAVLAGGIRRAACISFFDVDDQDMLTCKFENWWELNPQRARANNSAVVVRYKVKKRNFDSLWEKVKASGSGEPGFILTNNPDVLSNPCCFSGDTPLLTSEGYKEIKDLVGKEDLFLMSSSGVSTKGKVWSNGIKPLIEIEMENGDKIKCTKDHIFMSDNNEEIEAKDLLGKEIKRAENSLELSPVVSIVDAEEEEVFDFNLEHYTHLGIVGNGYVAHNCEIALKPFSFCNLCEVNVSEVKSQKEFNDRVTAAAFIGTLQAGYTNFHYLRDIWKKTTEKDALLGVSMTGIASNNVFLLDLTESAKKAVEENRRVAGLIGINTAARVTCVKPAGTTSLVLGCSSGIHSWHSPFYIRRIRVGKSEAVYKYLSKNNPSMVEDDFFKPTTQAVISVPIKAPEGASFRDESALNLLERVKKVSEEWIAPGHTRGDNSHNVSATISIKEDEWEEVGKWMWDNRSYYNGLSVLPYDGGSYKQAPFEEIDEKTYNRLNKKMSIIDFSQIKEEEDNTDLSGELACAGGSCEWTGEDK